MWSEVEGKPVNRERRKSTSKDKAVSSDLKARGAKAEKSRTRREAPHGLTQPSAWPGLRDPHMNIPLRPQNKCFFF